MVIVIERLNMAVAATIGLVSEAIAANKQQEVTSANNREGTADEPRKDISPCVHLVSY